MLPTLYTFGAIGSLWHREAVKQEAQEAYTEKTSDVKKKLKNCTVSPKQEMDILAVSEGNW